MDLFRSRKFWMAIASTAVVIVGHFVDVPQEEILAAVGAFVAAIIGQGVADARNGGSRANGASSLLALLMVAGVGLPGCTPAGRYVAVRTVLASGDGVTEWAAQQYRRACTDEMTADQCFTRLHELDAWAPPGWPDDATDRPGLLGLARAVRQLARGAAVAIHTSAEEPDRGAVSCYAGVLLLVTGAAESLRLPVPDGARSTIQDLNRYGPPVRNFLGACGTLDVPVDPPQTGEEPNPGGGPPATTIDRAYPDLPLVRGWDIRQRLEAARAVETTQGGEL